jgi:hypothetical protein
MHNYVDKTNCWKISHLARARNCISRETKIRFLYMKNLFCFFFKFYLKFLLKTAWPRYIFFVSLNFFSSPCQRQCELLPSLGIRRLNFSHFNLLFWNPSAIRNKNCLWQPCLLMIGTKWAIFIEDLP